MYSKIKTIGAAVVLFVASHAASATTLSLDYTNYLTGGCTTNCSVPASINSNPAGLTASAYYHDELTGDWTSTGMRARNENPTDHGFGVCSPGESCGAIGTGGSGDDNELSQATHQEVIVLTKPAGYSWSDLVISSLDSGGTNGAEQGTLFWSSTDFTGLSGQNQLNAFLDSTLAPTDTNSLAFSYGSNQGANQIDGEGSVFSLAGSSAIDKNANTLVFTSGAGSQIATGLLGNGGGSKTTCSGWGWKKTCTTTGPLNNDYLVQSAAALHAIPEPGTIALMGIGLAGFAASRARARSG